MDGDAVTTPPIPTPPKTLCNFIPNFPIPAIPKPAIPKFAIPNISLNPLRLICMLDRFI